MNVKMELAVDQLHFCNQQRNHFLTGPGMLFQGLGRSILICGSLKLVSQCGPKKLFYPPTYTPPPQSERVTDAVNRAQERGREAEEAKRQLEDATNKVKERLAEDNNLRGELEHQMQINQELRDQIDKGFSASSHVPATTASPAPTQPATDPLAAWGEKLS
jgi:predicted  nucleic acid-binding Zn-ribbon protein